MSTLPTDLRNKLERACIAARNLAERAATDALKSLAVAHHEPYGHMTPVQRSLRNKLWARAKQLGDTANAKGQRSIDHLAQECAYEQWHRMLFARFLAENNLLIEPEMGVAVSLDEVKELAKDAKTNLWTLAGRYAQTMLPEIFRADDPVLQVPLAREDQIKLEALLDALATDTFTASDSLGWCYQFWQAERKDQVNAAGNKIGADELPSVTQLFTEDYMVDFLLDNTLGAWWAGKKLTAENAKNAEFKSEEEVRRFCALPGCPWKYLRFIRTDVANVSPSPPSEGGEGRGEVGFVKSKIDQSLLTSAATGARWQPAAGRFDGWPKTAKELKCLDPCCGSGHFIVAMFERVVALRMAEEKLAQTAAVQAAIRENIFGLELDPRCTQIGAFSLALAAWRRVGHCALPAMHIACSGLAPNTREADWLKLAGDSDKLQRGMARLYRLFKDAPVLGSLINPHAGGDLLEAGFQELRPLLEKALKVEEASSLSQKQKKSLEGSATFPPINYFQPDEPVAHLAGDLPHWRQPGTTYFVTFRCADALPQEKLHQWQQELAQWHAAHPEPHDDATRQEFYERFPQRIQTWLDSGYGECVLREPALREIVESALRHFDGQRYRLQEFVVAANHVHALVTPLGEHRLSDILHSWKSFTANKINEARKKSGAFWQKESFDHIVRSPASLAKFREYILSHNKVAAASSRTGKRQDASATFLEMAVTAQGIAKAAEILAGQFTLVATNVPYLGRGKQNEMLQDYCERVHPEAKADLATCFVERCISFCMSCGTTILVSPQNWFFLGTYKKLRQQLFCDTEWNLAVKLGPAAFQNMNFWAAKTALCALSRKAASSSTLIAGFDASETRDPSVKGSLLLSGSAFVVSQLTQLKNPDARLLLSAMDDLPLLEKHGNAFQGIATADYSRFGRCFWELSRRSEAWQFQQSTVETTNPFSGREHIFLWENGNGFLAASDQARIQGLEAIGKFGVAVSQMNQLPVTLFTGEYFDNNCSALVVHDKKLLPAVWSYCSSEQFLADVREIDQAVKVTNASLVKVPFDLAHWQKVAAEKYPHGLPKPFSSDPTQWLFNGHPKVEQPSRLLSSQNQVSGTLAPLLASPEQSKRDACSTLQVAVARLVGYQWPRQTGSSFPDCPALGPDGLEKFADDDGIVCLPSVRGESPAAERVRQLLQTAYSGATVPVAAASRKPEACSTFYDTLQQTVYFNPYEPIEVTERNLPHWRQPGVSYFVTFRLADALPAEKLAQIKLEREAWLKTHAEPFSEADQQEYFRLFSERVQDWLDAGAGACLLRDERAAGIVANALKHFDGQRYELGSWVVMPNHVHAVVTPGEGWELDKILHAWKSFTSHEINKVLGRSGTLWQHEGYDHIVRNPRALWRIEQYIAENPAKAGITTKFIFSRLPQGGATVPVAVLGKSNRDDCSTFNELELIRASGSDAADLEEWLRNDFFEQHCDRFYQRPFVWHIWDGRKRDGFHALVNYHTLAADKGKGRRTLESLTHSYLGDWITRQKDGLKRGEEGADERLAAALALKETLEAIINGEPPYDVFVRWKPLAQQVVGWNPDINDGVRMNIRPFMASDITGGKKGAGVLRIKPNIKWDKDRGKEPKRDKAEYPWFYDGSTFTGDRVNDVHLTKEQKEKAKKT